MLLQLELPACLLKRWMSVDLTDTLSERSQFRGRPDSFNSCQPLQKLSVFMFFFLVQLVKLEKLQVRTLFA